MTKTTNYNLNQWEAEDVIKREDFNADNAAIDAAIKAASTAAATAQSTANTAQSTANSAGSAASAANTNANGRARFAHGTYAGSGNYGPGKPKTLTFSFEPKLVIISPTDSATTTAVSAYQEIVVLVKPLSQYLLNKDAKYITLTWSANSVSLSSDVASAQCDMSGKTYAYVAFG